MWPLVDGFILFGSFVGLFRNELSARSDNDGYGGDVKVYEHFAEEFPLA